MFKSTELVIFICRYGIYKYVPVSKFNEWSKLSKPRKIFICFKQNFFESNKFVCSKKSFFDFKKFLDCFFFFFELKEKMSAQSHTTYVT